MKKVYLYGHICLLLFKMAIISSCSGQSDSNALKNNIPALSVPAKTGAQIDEYVVEIFGDKKGNLWLGTISKGVARYDGQSLTYFSTKDGLCGNTVASITEDKDGNMWFGTHSGLSKYDGKTFTNFTGTEGLCNERVSNVLIDKAGNIWVGTWNGVCRYNGATFSNFPLPVPDIEVPDYQTTTTWVTQMIEDRQGNIWICRSGYGVCKYDPATGGFTQFTKKDGLASNCVQAIQEDSQGNIWLGSRVAENDNPDPAKRTGDGGLSRYNPSALSPTGGKTFMQYPEVEGLSKNDIYAITEDKKGNIWIGANKTGVYRYDGKSFHIYKGTDRMDLTYGFGVQSILEDKNGTIWFGFSGGLFRLNGNSIVNVTEDGPWK